MSDFVVPDSAVEHPPCMARGRHTRFPCLLSSDHTGDHRDSRGDAWAAASAETREPLRRLPWTSPDGKPEYVAPGNGLISQIADSVETHMVAMALADATHALAMAELANTTREDLHTLVDKLVGAVLDVVNVAELRGERLEAVARA